ncbi:hypothetical protein L3Y34_001095 [Caenorhabditis briggsae]|uniref:Protein CBR-SUCH-1 n=1 Tax=Caenorhabditis briggsae TaxID=6238 RepID=A0AAE9DBW0_CAEBR|nr:hypothetical protein L3Y34_001095 [Caenorhabditis briggsae]
MPAHKVRAGINLDTIFGNPLVNVTGEPITPTKIAIFYLIRTLFQSHFGIGAVPSLKPFDKYEKTKAFSVLYSLILRDAEVSYEDFRIIARMLNDELDRSVYYHFTCSVEKLANGEEQLEMLFEDSFYTAKRPTHENVLKRETKEMDMLTFMSSTSFMYVWIKRVMIQYTRTSQEGIFTLTRNFHEWINKKKISSIQHGINVTLPFDIDCSVRARQWIGEQLRLIQFCPSKAMPCSEITNWCHIIRRRHRDVSEVNLMEAIVQIQLQDPPSAVDSLKEFFDLSMLHLTESANAALNTLKLIASNPGAMRYGPILQGRICRIFGDRISAHTLFTESIQQSQVNVDDMCNRIANIELTINEVFMAGPILMRAVCDPSKKDDNENNDNSKNEVRTLQDTIHAAADINMPTCRTLQKSVKEDYELHAYLVSLSKFMLCIEDLMDGKYFRFNSTADYVAVGLHRLRLMSDAQSKGRVVEDFAGAIMTSALIQSGMYNQARRASEELLVNNNETKDCPKFETENQVVAGVNLVYSLASIGDYETAFDTISSLKLVFPEHLNWLCSRHITICSSIINFEKDFLLNQYSACFEHVQVLSSLAPLEFVLRKSILLAVTGKLSEAVLLLKEYKCEDVRGMMRVQMQLATIGTAYGRYEASEYHLEEAGKIAINAHFQDANFLVTRRIGSMLLTRCMPEEAYQILASLIDRVESFGTYIEKAIYYVSMARCLRMQGEDPRDFLRKCKLQIVNNRWPAMEKLILTELTILHHSLGMFPDENRMTWATEQFSKLEADFPGTCTWLFI